MFAKKKRPILEASGTNSSNYQAVKGLIYYEKKTMFHDDGGDDDGK